MKYHSWQVLSIPAEALAVFMAVLMYGLSALFIVLMQSNITVAQAPPLSQGCYYRVGDRNFERISCPTEGYARLTSGAGGNCYVTRSQESTIMFHVHCGSGDVSEVMARNSHNLRQSQNVCEAIEANSYWSPTTRTCNWGTSCVIAGPNTGTGCERMTSRQTYQGYVSSSLPLPGGSSATGAGSAPVSTSPVSGSPSSNISDTPIENTTPRQQCLNEGREWVNEEGENSEDPNNGICRAYQSRTTNDCQEGTVSSSNCGIIRYLVVFINTLAVLAGIVITASIVVAGMQYSSAGSDPQKVSAAKDRIRNSIIALLLFIFGYSLLAYLIPGGLL